MENSLGFGLSHGVNLGRQQRSLVCRSGKGLPSRRNLSVVVAQTFGPPGAKLFGDDEWEDEVDVVEGGRVPYSARIPNRDRGYLGNEDLVSTNTRGKKREEVEEEENDEETITLVDVDYDLTGIEFRDKFKTVRKVEWWDAPMKKTMQEIRDMNLIEVMIELRDMRLPRTGTHPLFRVWRRTKNFLSVVIYTHTENFSQQDMEDVRNYTMNELSIPGDQVSLCQRKPRKVI